MTDHTRTEKISGDSIFIFVVFQVERETVMTLTNIMKSTTKLKNIKKHLI